MAIFTAYILLFGLPTTLIAEYTPICGERGYLTNPPGYFIADNQTVSLEKCREWCDNMDEIKYRVDESCEAIGHNTTNNLCIFYPYGLNSPQTPSLGFQEDPASTVTFYSRNCSKFIPNCDAPTNYNLLDNAGFHGSPTLVGPWLSKVSIAKFDRSPSTNGVILKGTSTISQLRGLCAFETYRLKVDYKIVKPSNATTALRISMGDCEANPTIYDDKHFLRSWHTWQCSFQRASANSQIANHDELAISAYGSTSTVKTYIADPVVERIQSPNTMKTVGPSLLDNGDFETGDYMPWKVSADAKKGTAMSEVVSPGFPSRKGAQNSKYKFRFNAQGEYDGYYTESIGRFKFEQTLNAATELGKAYLFTMSYQAFNTEGFDVSPIGDVIFSNADTFFPLHGFPNRTGVFPRIFTGSGKIDTLSMTFVARSEVQPRVNFTIFLDNLSIRKLADQ